MQYSYGYQAPVSDYTWLIISAVIAVIGGLFVYIYFVSKENKYDGFLNWLHDFLNFKTFFIETLLKVLYTMSAIFITLGSFSFIGSNTAMFFGVLIFGNLAARVLFELILMTLTIVSNTSEINKKLDYKNKDARLEKKVDQKKEIKPKKDDKKKNS